MTILNVQDIKKTYTTRLGGEAVQALRGVSFSVEQGEFVAVMGESGSGKTTLLNILATLDRPTSGSVLLHGKRLQDIREKDIAAFRREQLGFIFQDFHLLDTFTLRDNAYLPLVLAGMQHGEMEKRIAPIAKQLGIDAILDKYPYEVSGGQKQRAAIARALITDPKLILADEPTGALDSKSADQLLKLLCDIHAQGQTLLMVTHSVRAACHASRVLFIRDGELVHQIYRGENGQEQQYQLISDALTRLVTGGERIE